MDLEEKGEEYDELAATLRRVASARPKKELSFVIADYESVMALVSRFEVRWGER